ncbi:ASST-domain-containing protein [Aspergillus pseudoustus]|uniref:ASST-domain-containing protein n=1 Tax=Aspergillus pseudoustus TaxID=1810923 RepID=A0ABR4IU88_9EURO
MLLPKGLALASLPLVLANTQSWPYLSRPDLTPPKLNITIPYHHPSTANPDSDSDYIFIAPYSGFGPESSGPTQPGAYILRRDGDLVWSGQGYLAGYVANFGPAVIDGRPVLKAAQGLLDGGHGRMFGDHVVLNERYETVKVLGAAGSRGRLVSVHEFDVQVDDGGKSSVLVEVPVPVPVDLGAFGGVEGQRWVLSSGFQEIDIETGELLFEWYSLDHISPNATALPLSAEGPFNAFTPHDAWDYFHLNSAAKDAEGNYLISGRNVAAIYKINGTDGSVIWQLGGPVGSDFEIPSNVQFAFQHDARIRYRSDDGVTERISFFDNEDHSQPGHGLGQSSRARYVELNHAQKTVAEIQTFWPPDGIVANSQGNAQFLENGNVFVNWGQGGAITEFSANGEVLFHAYLDSYPSRDVQSYRGFRAPWVGYSSEEVAVLVLGGEGEVEVFVSWNGDTETRAWWVYLVDAQGEKKELLGKKERTGFETSFPVKIDSVGQELGNIFVVAEARDGRGNVLGRSRAAGVSDRAPYRARLDTDDSQETGFGDQARLDL